MSISTPFKRIPHHLLFALISFTLVPYGFANSSESKATSVDQRSIHAADDNREADNWLSYGRGYFEQRHSPLTHINQKNVDQLKLAWFFDTGNTQGLQATPLVIDGVMYVTAAWSILHAIDAKTGEELWQFDPEVPREESFRYCCGVVNRGAAAWQDSLFIGTLDGRLIAIDRHSGQSIWSTQTTPKGENYSITGAPRVVKGKVIIGNGGSEYGVRGFVSAYDANNGEMLWRFYTVPGNPANGFENPQMELAAKTWTGNWWEHGAGGTVWDAMAYDPELDLLYIGVGNGAPHNRNIRSPFGGDNLFLCSILALKPDTGEYVWHYQEVPAETWDYTATQTIVLADIDWQGKTRKVLMQAPKAGFFYILDRETGELLSAEPYAKKVTWASHYDMETGRPVEVEGQDYTAAPAMVYPVGLGAHNWHPMSYSPDTGLMYIPAQHIGGELKQEDNYQRYPRHWNTGVDTSVDMHNAALSQTLLKTFVEGYLLAWDPIKQQVAWTADHQTIGNGGTLSTAGNLVFQGTVDGSFKAFNAKNGEQLWRFNTQNGIVGSPISYRVDDQQFITVPAGRGGGLSQIIGIQHEVTHVNGRILAFTLTGSESLPAVDKLSIPKPPAMPQVSDDILSQGAIAYSRFCSRCHGTNVVSDGAIPDLRHLETVWHDNFNAVVLDGMMEAAGMPRFDDVLDEQSAAAIQAFIIEQAHQEYQRRENPSRLMAVKNWLYQQLADGLKFLSELQ